MKKVFVLIGAVFITGVSFYLYDNTDSSTDSSRHFDTQTHEIQEKLEIFTDFIYVIEHCRHGSTKPLCPVGVDKQIVVSDIGGQNPVVLKSFPEQETQFEIYLPSPKGSYYFSEKRVESENLPPCGNYYAGDCAQKYHTVFDLDGKEMLSIEIFPLGGFVPNNGRWSPDEKYIAFLGFYNAPPGMSRRLDKERVLVYDVELGEKVYDEKLEDIKRSEVGDPYSTNPTLAWSEDATELFVNNELGIVKVTNLDSRAQTDFMPTPVACLGMVFKSGEFYCHSKIGNLFMGDDPINETFVFKYRYDGKALSDLKRVTVDYPLEGEYGARLLFLNDKYLLFNPSLAADTVIDVDTGRIGGSASWKSDGRKDFSNDIYIFSEWTHPNGNISFPIKYLGD